MQSIPILSLIVFLPLVGAVVAVFIKNEEVIRGWALAVSLVTFLLSLPLFFFFEVDVAGMQFVERVPWIPGLGVSYYLGVDGISLLLVLLTTLLTPIVILASWGSIGSKGYYILLLLLETGTLGVFVALDLILFYVFWEVALIPMYFIVSEWGGKRRMYAALKFVLYTMAGSVLMLVGILALYFLHAQETGGRTFAVTELMGLPLPVDTQLWLFVAFTVAFAIKSAIVPLHTWLPDAYGEAPTGGTVLLAGVLSKMGIYGLLRFSIPLFPEAAQRAAPLLMALGMIGVVYGYLIAWAQRDMKRLAAYASLGHLGIIVLGIFALNRQGLQGGLLEAVNHGVSISALFLIIGMLAERRGTTLMEQFGGVWQRMPFYALFFLITILSLVGLPGLNCFVGEFTILVGAFRANALMAGVAAAGLVLMVVFMLGMFRRVMQGPLTREENQRLPDLNRREVLVLVPLIVLIFVMGLYPGFFLSRMDTAMSGLMQACGYAMGR